MTLALRKPVDDNLKRMMKDGTLTRLWDKWFLQPIPPKNAHVGLVLPESTKQAWAKIQMTSLQRIIKRSNF